MAAARPGTQSSRAATAFRRSSSSTRSGLSGAGGSSGEPALLASCYRRSLELAVGQGIASIAFPAISTGVYGYPVGAAAEIAVATVRSFAARPGPVKEVVFCCYSSSDHRIYVELLA